MDNTPLNDVPDADLLRCQDRITKFTWNYAGSRFQVTFVGLDRIGSPWLATVDGEVNDCGFGFRTMEAWQTEHHIDAFVESQVPGDRVELLGLPFAEELIEEVCIG